ncbi:MAG: DegV family protein, partial [Oscillospiraceae bacterium]
KIMVDKAADIEKDVANELGIEVLPFIINVGDESIVADINLDTESFYEKVEAASSVPTTSQMSPNDLEKCYRRLAADGSSVIYISISANASGINNTANLVARELNDEGFDITVVDSTMFSSAIGYPAIEAAKLAQNNASKEEILSYLTETFNRDSVYFMVDDLTFLKKGGRIKATTMVIGSMLDIKPILMIKDGLVEAYKKVRGTKKALSILCGYVEERMENPSENEVLILHSRATENLETLTKMIEDKVHPAKISTGNVGPVITSHAGLGVIGVYFKHKESYKNYVS